MRSPVAPSAADIEAKLQECAANTAAFVDAVLNYPKSMSIPLGDVQTHGAAVDISGKPAGPADDVPNGEATRRPLKVQCEISANLTSSDTSLQIATTDEDNRVIGPDGRAAWTWQVTAAKSGSHELVLTLRPAVSVGTKTYAGDPEKLSYTRVTKVEVTTTVVRTASSWWTTNWPLILVMVAGVGAAITGLVKWGGSLKEALRKAREGDRPPAPDESRGGPPPAPGPGDGDRAGYL